MIRPFIAVLTVYTLSLWLFPTASPTIFPGFAAMVLLLSLARGKNGQRIPGVIPSFVLLASVVMLLLYLPTVIETDFMRFAGLFIGFYCGAVLVLRLFTGYTVTWIVTALVTVLVFALESRYYGAPGYTVELQHSLALLTALASVIGIAIVEFVYRIGCWLGYRSCRVE
uniref:Uncharacterized protein n=1 Tax=Candidatus Kentrum sp. FM TaxID=2126340 RepID=A0A450VNM1_9GAMM|nr:MAG: hypothetical protein BECKFM1743C_GA0114222_100143 [Candidatus Kentron sp. FM]VFJ53481.1 MAG: hypothetical protein BECKFM1743A_GA0114220_101153 [Candidatus Kentron sp. FM]VFK06341.1 MAG: hypothetical protein BECKFM1743B_GA0114221_1001415 [Candidatus Kentron sp. FM]